MGEALLAAGLYLLVVWVVLGVTAIGVALGSRDGGDLANTTADHLDWPPDPLEEEFRQLEREVRARKKPPHPGG